MKRQAAVLSPAEADVGGASAARCPLCRGGGKPSFEKLGYIHHTCSTCRTLFVYPVPSPDALAAYYQDPGNEQK